MNSDLTIKLQENTDTKTYRFASMTQIVESIKEWPSDSTYLVEFSVVNIDPELNKQVLIESQAIDCIDRSTMIKILNAVDQILNREGGVQLVYGKRALDVQECGYDFSMLFSVNGSTKEAFKIFIARRKAVQAADVFRQLKVMSKLSFQGLVGDLVSACEAEE